MHVKKNISIHLFLLTDEKPAHNFKMEVCMTRKLARVITIVAKTMQVIVFIYSLLWFAFAILSGSEAYGGGFQALVKNSPNAIPWLILLLINIISWGWERTGGILYLIFGVFSFFFFHAWSFGGFVMLVVTIPYMIIGILSIFYWSFKTTHPNYYAKVNK
jgi:hypothetical protein